MDYLYKTEEYEAFIETEKKRIVHFKNEKHLEFNRSLGVSYS